MRGEINGFFIRKQIKKLCLCSDLLYRCKVRGSRGQSTQEVHTRLRLMFPLHKFRH